MFGKKSEGAPVGKIDSLIGAGACIEGVVRFSGGLRIDGEIKGAVEAAEGAETSMLILSERARIEGPVKVSHLVSSGTVVGAVTACKSLELHPSARIVGDVEYVVMEMHQGAVVEGRLLLRRSPEELAAASGVESN